MQPPEPQETHRHRSREGSVLLCFSIGLPGRFAEWCDAVVARLANWPAEPARLCELASTEAILDLRTLPPSLDTLARTLIDSTAADVVIAARQPDLTLHTALA